MAGFLPINAREMRALGWERPDFVDRKSVV